MLICMSFWSVVFKFQKKQTLVHSPETILITGNLRTHSFRNEKQNINIIYSYKNMYLINIYMYISTIIIILM